MIASHSRQSHLLAKAIVRNLQCVPIEEQNVLQLQIPVRNVLLVDVRDGVYELQHPLTASALLDRPILLYVCELQKKG